MTKVAKAEQLEVPAPSPPPELNLPEIATIGWHRTTQGWTVVRCVVRGSRVMSFENLGGPDPTGVARERLLLAAHDLVITGLRGGTKN